MPGPSNDQTFLVVLVICRKWTQMEKHPQDARKNNKKKTQNAQNDQNDPKKNTIFW